MAVDTTFFLRRDTSADLWSPQSLADPGADAFLYFSAETAPSSPFGFATIGSGLSFVGGVLSATGGGGPTSANPSATIGLTAVNGSAATFMTSDSAPPLSQSIMPTWTGVHTFQQSPGNNTYGDGIFLNNPTAATSGNQQYSPGIHFKSFGFATTGSHSRSVEWHIYSAPIQGASNPTGAINFDSSVNGAAYATRFSFATTGFTVNNITVTGNATTAFLVFTQMATPTGSPAVGSIANFTGIPASNSGLNSGDLFVVSASTAVANGYNVVCMT